MSKGREIKPVKDPNALFDRVVSILEQARNNVVRAVNTNMVQAYWLIGREIVEEIQGGKGRAQYGEQVVANLSAQLTARYGKGFSETTLQYFRKFYLAYAQRYPSISRPMGVELQSDAKSRPAGVDSDIIESIPCPPGNESPQGFSPHLSWSHYRALMRVENKAARDFYEREAVAGGWDKRTHVVPANGGAVAY